MPGEAQPDLTVELTARFTIPAAFTVDEADQLAQCLVDHLVDDLRHEHGPEGTVYDGAYISAVETSCRVVGHQDPHIRSAEWGHGDRCHCHHPIVDHECPDEIDGAPGRCFARDCGCRRYMRLSGEA
jgi:hypothetical protein